MPVWSLPAAYGIVPIPNAELPCELKSFSEGGPLLDSAASPCIHNGPLLVVVCAGFAFPFFPF